MQIHGLQSAQAAQSINQANTAKQTPAVENTAASNSIAADELDLSAEAQALIQAQDTGTASEGIRTDKVAAIRQAIADGSYETPEKISAALDKMLDTFA